MRLWPTILVALFASPSLAQDSRDQKPERLRVMSFNLWHSRTDLKARTEAAARLLKREAADLVGLQEVSGSLWRRNRAKLLAGRLGYDYRYKISDGLRLVFAEGLAVLSKQKIKSAGREKLVHSKLPPFERRFVQWAETTLPSGQRVMLFNTHLTHHDAHGWQVERLEQALQVIEVVAKRALARDVPAVLVGDLNSEPNHLAVRALTGKLLGRAPFVDAWRVAGKGEGHTTPEGERIDYVLALRGTRRALQPQRARILRQKIKVGAQRVQPSDHYGLVADFVLAPAQAAPLPSRRGLRGQLEDPNPHTDRSPRRAKPNRAARSARALVRRVRRVRQQIEKIRAGARGQLERAARAESWEDEEPAIDAKQLRRLVLKRVLKRFKGS